MFNEGLFNEKDFINYNADLKQRAAAGPAAIERIALYFSISVTGYRRNNMPCVGILLR